MNFQKISFVKTFGLMFVWWFPHFLVYLIDLSIWYSVWISAAGGLVSLIERQGAVRDSASFRSHFIRSPLAFAQRLLHDTSSVRQKSSHLSASTAALNELILQPKVSEEKSSPVMKAKPIRAASKAMSSADLQSLNFTAKSSNNKNDKKSGDKTFNEGMTDYLSDVRSQRWIIFSKVWNEIVSNLRAADHLSNFEREILSFSTSNELLLPVYLPIYQTAGCVSTSINLFKDSCNEYSSEAEPEKKIAVIEKFYESMDVTMIEAVSEAWELLTYLLLKILGPSHKADIESLTNSLLTMAKTNDLFGNINPDALPQILNYATNIVSFIKSSATKRKNNPIVTEAVIVAEEKSRKKALAAEKHINNTAFISNGNSSHSKPVSKMKKSVSAGFLPSLGADFSSEVNNKPTNKSKEVTRKFVMPEPIVQSTFVLNDTLRDKLRDEIRNILNQIKGALRGKARAGDLLGKITFILSFESGFFWNDIYASIQLDSLLVQKPETTDRVSKFLTIVNKLNNLLKLRQSDVELSSQEAIRRLNFFINSLFMDIPVSPSIKYCKEYTTMTPYYSEDVILSREDLESKNSDGVSTLLYLQTLYKRDWLNYLERCNIKDEQHVWSDQHIQSTRIWASLRAQTLYRTVDGIMTTEAALRLLAEIENMNKTDIDTYACMKFNYVVACQVYGHMKKTLDPKADDIEYLLKRHPNLRVAYIDNLRANRERDTHYYSDLIKYDQTVKEIYRIKLPGNPVLGEGKPQVYGHMKKTLDPKADDIEYLLKRHPNLRVAYIDNVRANREGDTHYYSVLIKYDQTVKEIYRIKLPGNPVLGEGKPENQNHAIVFTRGRYLQAIDMNQDAYFEEGLKMKNLLQEFELSKCAILGFREHIFTGSVSSVANYMALQELSFVTLGQRVLNNPLCIRQHYGHPDLFDKFFVMTEGGMSKASKGINLSEDVFSGFNATIRGRSVNFKEYVNVGKGRDVGLQQTYKFEAKLSQGNAEQSISRDMSRICDRLDFYRLLSFYYGGIGHYVSNTMVMFTLVVVVYTMVGLAIYKEEGVNQRPILPEGIFQMVLAGMGVIQTFPLAVTLTVEKGMFKACSEIFYMMISGGPLYFIFHIQTKCFYFQQTLLAGNAIYRPTGRGFVIRHSPFDENYRFFATSHIYLGFELMMALILLAIYTESSQYGGLTWSLWMATVAFLLGPFWFNPVTFEWNKLSEDYTRWIQWMTETSGNGSEQSCPLFFIFHIQTKSFYFQQTLLAGNAIYRPTGRGFVIRHLPFDENYRFFATSHIYLGFELMMALVLLAIYTESKQYGALTWSLWIATVAFLLGPFLFNPMTFEWNKLTEDYTRWKQWMAETSGNGSEQSSVTFEWNKLSEDYTRWIQWMTETSGNGSEQSWDSWWKEENQFYKKLSFSWKCLMIVQKCFIWLFIAFGLFGWKFIDDNTEIERLFEVFGLFIIFFLGHWCISKLEKALSYGIRRFTSLMLSGFVSGMVIYLFISHGVYVRYTLATYYVGSAIAFLSLLTFGVTGPIAHIYKIHDYLVGHTIFILLAILTLLQFGYLQTWLLYHNALSAGVVMDDILKYARKSKERALDDETLISKLKEQVDQQAITIKVLTDKIIGNGEIELLEKTSLLGPLTVSKTAYGSTGESNPTGFAVSDLTAKSAVDAISTTNRVVINQSKQLTPDTPVAATTTIPFTGVPNTYNTAFQNVIADTNMNILTGDPTSPMISKTSWDTTLTPSNKSLVDISIVPPPTDFVFIQPTQFPARHNDGSSKGSSSKSSSTKSS
eukprot:CAMPEP_0196767632 /NCGR_PEP_ID=MMETSP1095-20130614/41799_1 /TAXON_ID=96789 ORGANISM="Chromulina nebulosa, Strain UTEXLB2642" /NCGR_SAMPLE_ID=MMETSP1095 /ASSEMBLY_ACC=CAM_ASM_000446 /LENGTH=1772 /DNA_ID=CAMNT_0042136127 /DNA_START=2165 /DNA_END=7482 /DNA_ORIENTATION=-